MDSWWRRLLESAVAIILAVGVSATVIIIAVKKLFEDGHVTSEEVTLLSTALGAMVGAVATYLGVHERGDSHYEVPPPPPPPPPPPSDDSGFPMSDPS